MDYQLIVEPFFEEVATGGDLVRLGYRARGGSATIAMVDVPASLVVRAASISLRLTLTVDGTIVACSREVSNGDNRIVDVGLDELVRASVSPANLHLEEATTADLTRLLQRLERSAELVRLAIENVNISET